MIKNSHVLQKDSLHICNPLVQARSLKVVEQQDSYTGVFSWEALNMVYHVKNIKGSMFPSQAIVLRGSGPGSPFSRGSLPNVVIIFKWVCP